MDENRLASSSSSSNFLNNHDWIDVAAASDAQNEYRDDFSQFDFYNRIVRSDDKSAPGMLPVMRTGRSDPTVLRSDVTGMLPIFRAGRSESMVPMMRTGRMDNSMMSSMVPLMRTGRSDGIVPMMRTGRSSTPGLVPFPRTGRSAKEGMIPILRQGRSGIAKLFNNYYFYTTDCHPSLHETNNSKQNVMNQQQKQLPHDERDKSSIEQKENENETKIDFDDENNLIIAWLLSNSNNDDEMVSKKYSNSITSSTFKEHKRQLIPSPRFGR